MRVLADALGASRVARDDRGWIPLLYADFADDPKRVSLAPHNSDDQRKAITQLKSVLDPDGSLEPREFARLVLSTGLAGRNKELIEKVALELYST